MTDIPPRCPFCANVLKIQPSFWTRLGFKPNKVRCSACERDFEQRDAHTMGAQYWNWAELFRKQLTDALSALPILSEHAALAALGSPLREDIRVIPALDELTRHCLRHHRHALIEMTRGREATLEVVPLKTETTAAVDAAAIISTTSAESGAQRLEQIIARTGMSHFVLCTPPNPGAVPPIPHAQAPSVGTNPHAVANMQSRHGQPHAHHA